jgi:hypothetical protein
MHSRRSVFISATSRGFAWWRKALADILIAQDIEPLEQTWLTPESEIVQRQIEDFISSATGVICLIGIHYGYPSEKRKDGTPPLSYSQYEWCLATKWNKPRLVYMVAESFFKGVDIPAEADPKVPDSTKFSEWQTDFCQTIRDNEKKYPHRCIASPQALGVALAMINWRKWPSDE